MENKVRRNRRKGRTSLITNIFFCIIALAALTGCILLLLQNYTLKNRSEETMAQLKELEIQSNEYIYSQSDVDTFKNDAALKAKDDEKGRILNDIKDRMGSGGSTAAMLRDFFPENIVVYSDGAYNFFPISEQLKKHEYVYDYFKVQDDKEISYVDESGQTLSRKGIDVSKFQEKIDWKKVAGDGVEYAFIRAGLRGSSEGKLVEDEQFKNNIEGALKNGLDAGVYFYTQATSEAEAIEEAEFVLDLIEPYKINYPVVFDIEEPTSPNARTAGMTREEHTKAAIAFCERIKKAGYTPMIYGNLKSFLIMLDMEQLEQYEKWFAYYNEPVYFPYDFSMWQYTSEGSVNGIKGKVDINISMKDWGKE